MSEYVRAIGVTDGRDDRCAAVRRQVTSEVVHARAAEHERNQEAEVVCGVAVSRGPVDRHRERTGSEIGFRIGEGSVMWIEDVGVEHVTRIAEERTRNPRDVPD